MLRLYKDEWPGNKWPAIEIYPVDKAYFLAILTYLSSLSHHMLDTYESFRVAGMAD